MSKVVATTLTKGKNVSGGQSPFCGEFWMKENEKQGGGRIYGEGKREIYVYDAGGCFAYRKGTLCREPCSDYRRRVDRLEMCRGTAWKGKEYHGVRFI